MNPVTLLLLALVALACSPAPSNGIASRYERKFRADPCTNSFCINADPEVEARRMKLARMERTRSAPTPRANSTETAPSPPPQEKPPAPPAPPRPAPAPKATGATAGSLEGLPRLRHNPAPRFKFPPQDPASPATLTDEIEISIGTLTLSDAKSEKGSLIATLEKLSDAKWKLTVRPAQTTLGSLMDTVLVRSSHNEDWIKLPARGWIGRDVIVSPGWWDVAAPGTGQPPKKVQIEITTTEASGAFQGASSIPEGLLTVSPTPQSGPGREIVDVELNAASLPSGPFEASLSLKFEKLAQPVIWKVWGIKP